MNSLLCCIPRETPEVDFEVQCTSTCCAKQVIERRRSIKKTELKDEVDGKSQNVANDDDDENFKICCCFHAKRRPRRDET